jgi:hypothetical protein
VTGCAEVAAVLKKGTHLAVDGAGGAECLIPLDVTVEIGG